METESIKTVETVGEEKKEVKTSAPKAIKKGKKKGEVYFVPSKGTTVKLSEIDK